MLPMMGQAGANHGKPLRNKSAGHQLGAAPGLTPTGWWTEPAADVSRQRARLFQKGYRGGANGEVAAGIDNR